MALTAAEIQAKIDKLEINMDRLDDITNGPDTMDVEVDSGDVPTISKFFKTIGDQTGGYTQQAIDAAERAEAALEAIENSSGGTVIVKLDTISIEGVTEYAFETAVPTIYHANVYLGSAIQPKDGSSYIIINSGMTLKLSEAPPVGTRIYAEGAAIYGVAIGNDKASLIQNDSGVSGTTVADALDQLKEEIANIDTGGSGPTDPEDPPVTEFAAWPSARFRTIQDRSKFICHISDFCAPSTTTARSTEIVNWITQAQTAGVKAVLGSDGNGIADYITERELEITKPGQVVEFENTGGFAYGDNVGSFWSINANRLVRLRAAGTWFSGTSGKRVRTRRLYRGSASDPQDAALSAVINIQAEGVQLIRPHVWLNCDYNNTSPTNFGDNVDVGIFIGCRVGVQIHHPQVIGYYRRAGIYLDVSGKTGLQRHLSVAGTPYPVGTVQNGADGFHMWNPYIRGGRVGFAVLGALPKSGQTDYSTAYYDQQLGGTTADSRGSFGCSDLMVYGGKIYGPDHHSNRRLANPVSSTLSQASLLAEPDNSPAALHIDGLAGNASTNIWGMTFVGTRIATFEKFRARLGKVSRARFIGCHTEGRNDGRTNTSGSSIDSNNFTTTTYGNYSGLPTTDRITIIGAVTHNDSDTFPHFYGEKPTLISDSGRFWSYNGIYSQGTSAGTSVVISSTGQLRRNTSALKYKTDLRPIPSEKLELFSQLVGFLYKSIIEGDDNESDNIGFIADYADEIGLTELVNYSEKGEPESFKYDRAVVLVHELQKLNNEELREKLSVVEQRLSTMEEKISVLESKFV